MPLYDWKCEDCQHRFEAVGGMNEDSCECPKCGWKDAWKLFTPTRNFLIPESFRRTSTWHMPQGERSADSAPASSNNAVHAPKRKSFKETFDDQWR
jgi:putative FmdB family regulatory protein